MSHRPRSNDFPISFHSQLGQYYKSIFGKRRYLGTDPDKASENYQNIIQTADPSALVLDLVVKKFLDAKRQQAADGDIQQRTVNDYAVFLKTLTEMHGRVRWENLTPDHFRKFRSKIGQMYAPLPS